MPRGFIPDNIIQQIKDHIDIVDVISEYVPLTAAGKNFKGLKCTLQIAPDHPSANKGLAVLYWEQGKLDQAWAAVQRCQQQGIPLDPQFIAALEADTKINNQ